MGALPSPDGRFWPFVSIVLPMRNERRHIERCLDSILATDYPVDRLEVLVVDGESDDGSDELVRRYAREHPVRLLSNPERIVPTAMNRGIAEARGDVIVRMDAHTTYAPDYVRRCVEALERTDAAAVGGVQAAVGSDLVTVAIAAATTSRFGVGNARFRYADREEFTDTVYLGAWRRATLEAAGGFDAAWVVNQDYELNCRLRRDGGKILLSPSIRCEYHVRDSLLALARQYFRYGMWRVKTLRAHPFSLRWRQLAPPAFVATLVSAALLSSVSLVPLTLIGGLYLLANLAASAVVARARGLRYLPVLPLTFACLHLCWGAGFLVGLVRFGLPGRAPHVDRRTA